MLQTSPRLNERSDEFCAYQAAPPAGNLLVTCPMHTTTSVQSLSVKSMQPISEHQSSSTSFVAWLYPEAPKGTMRCNPKTTVPFPQGDHQRILSLEEISHLLWVSAAPSGQLYTHQEPACMPHALRRRPKSIFKTDQIGDSLAIC